jgi:hypothetical protein
VISPVLDKISEQQCFAGVVDFYTINIDDVPKAAEEVGIKAVRPFFKE